MTTPYHNSSLYVGNLKPEATENDLFQHFSTAGQLHSTRVCRDSATRVSLKYGYVNFQNPADAERALDTLNYSMILDQPCRLMWSQRDPSLRRSGAGNIFIKNLEKSIDDKMLYDTFSLFGNILSCKIETDNEGNSRGFGFVHYETPNAAENAISKVHGKMINGLIVYVAPFIPKKKPTEARFNNVYVKNIDENATDEQLAALFGQFGPVISPKVMRTEDGRSLGFGFVCYEKHEDALKAIEALNNTTFLSKTLYCGRALKKAERQRQLQMQAAEHKNRQYKKFEGANLYVKYLDDETDDQRLHEEFKAFGHIIRAAVMKDEAGRSKGFGFVCFSTAEEAERAMREMHNKTVGSRPLYVTRAQRKEERRAQLEAFQTGRSQRMEAPFLSSPAGMYAPNLYYAAAAAAGMAPRPLYNYPPQMRYGPVAGAPVLAGPAGSVNPAAAAAAGMGPAGTGRPGPANPANPAAVGNPAGAANPAGAVNPAGPGPRGPYYAGPAGAVNPAMGPGAYPPRSRPIRSLGPNPGHQHPHAHGHPHAHAHAHALPPHGVVNPMRGPQGPGPNQALGGPQGAGPNARPRMSLGPNAGPGAHATHAPRFRFGPPNPGQQHPHAHPHHASRPRDTGVPQGTSIQHLSQASEVDQKRILGDTIYERVFSAHPDLATRITGMFLELETAELLYLIDSPDAFQKKTDEAIVLLREHMTNAPNAAVQPPVVDSAAAQVDAPVNA